MRLYEFPGCAKELILGVVLAARRGRVVLGFLMAAMIAPRTGEAVDLVNRDRKAHEVVVNRADGSSETLKIRAGQRVADICADCVILVGQSSVEARGRATIKIEGGEVSTASQR